MYIIILFYTCVQARLYTELRIQKLCDSFYPAFETLSVRLSLKSGNQSHFPMSNDEIGACSQSAFQRFSFLRTP